MPNIPQDVYPFSTADGKPIPLDILKPNFLVILDFTSNGVVSFNLPTPSRVAMFIATEAVLVSFEDSLASVGDKAVLDKTLIIPKGTIVSSVLPVSQIKIRGIDDPGTLYIQGIEQWAGVSIESLYQRK